MTHNNQGKSTQQYKDALTFTFIGFMGTLLTISLILLDI